jgi:hypothetical protein
MKSRCSALFLLFLTIFAQNIYATTNPEALARQAVSADPKESAPAITELRELGPAGLHILFQTFAEEINRQISDPLLASTPEWQRLSAALDAVSQQKDSYLSGLYWHTDLTQAKLAARASGKPILSLRLLGNLNEEFSCANSRFFRTILYSNAEVAKMLRERFILHWRSVRPAPRVTIDFGDGRKLERTVTGNSIHYILDSEGRTIDALPGLYGPQAFLRALVETEAAVQRFAKLDSTKLRAELGAYHRLRLNSIHSSWLLDTRETGGKLPAGLRVALGQNSSTPSAISIAPLAMTKMVTEASTLRSLVATGDAFAVVTDQAAWNKIARLHLADAQLDARSIGLIQRQIQNVLPTGGADTKPETTLSNLLKTLQMNIALDTVRNEYMLHRTLYAWLIVDWGRSDLEALNKKVYAELFLTPGSDPWLGLFSPETYMALDNGGVVR